MDDANCPGCGNPTDSPECLCCSTTVLERLRRGPAPRRPRLNVWALLSLACLAAAPAAIGLLVAHGRRAPRAPAGVEAFDIEGAFVFAGAAVLVLAGTFLGTLLGMVAVGLRRRYRGEALAWAGLALNFFLFLSPFLLGLGLALLGALAGAV
jgi:hypothetical protein